MEILNKIKTFSILLIVGILVWGCSSEPDELYFDSPQDDTEFWDENNSSGNQSEVDIKLLVEECVNVNVRYSDYIWYFDIESTLHHKLPNRKIEFGIGHGEINGIEHISIENEAYGYFSKNDGRKKTFMFTNPFWFYYVWGIDPSDKEAWTLSEMYHATYKSLIEQGINNLNKDESALFNKIKGLLDDLEKPMILHYRPSIIVRIDSKFYNIGRYSIRK